MVKGDGGKTPGSTVKDRRKLVELSGMAVLQHGPGKGQWHADVEQDLAQHAVPGPVGGRVGVDLRRFGGVFIDDPFQGGVRDDKAGATVGENDICNLRFGADIQSVVVVQGRQPGQQRPPREIRIRLHKHIPLRIRLVGVGLLHHGQELPLVQLPTGVIRLAQSRVGHVCKIGIVETGSAHRADAVVDVEVRDTLLDALVHVAQSVVQLHALDLLVKVTVDHVVGHATQRRLEMHRHLLLGLCHARLHHHQHILHPGQGRTHGPLCRLRLGLLVCFGDLMASGSRLGPLLVFTGRCLGSCIEFGRVEIGP